MSRQTSPGGLGTWFVGEKPQRRTILLAIVLGTSLAVSVLVIDSSPWWIRIIAALLAWDVGAGLVSNLSQSTHDQWASATRAAQIAFLTVHLTLYPLALLFLIQNRPLAWVMVALLVVKTAFFSRVLSASPH
jgi:hypothetical protein